MEAVSTTHRTGCDPGAGCVSDCPVAFERVMVRARRRRDRKSSVRWSSRACRLNKRARRVKAPGRVGGAMLRELVKTYESRCAYCGIDLEFEHPNVPSTHPQRGTFDHVKPLGRGGSGGIENLVPACAGCNQKRSTWPDAALGVPAPQRFGLTEGAGNQYP